jgi:hypothetical protein
MELDPFIPIAQNEDSLVFLNVRSALFWNDGDFSNEINAGAGYRRLMGDRSWILGGYAFYDFMDSQYDNHFNQGTLGIEALAWNWEARANGYIAEDDTEWAPGAETAGAGLVGTRLLLFGAIEQAMSGFDAEVGWRLPFFGEEGALSDTRLYAGGFWFDGSAVGSLGGPMTRFETRIWDVPFLPAESRVTLGTEYRWDHARNSQVTGLIAVRVPLGGAARSQPLTNVERRMTDRVVRDVSVVTDTSTQSSERVRTRTGAVVGDAYFFDNSTDGDGSFENPDRIIDVIADGGPNALLIGRDKTGNVDLTGFNQLALTLQDEQTVMGAGTGLRVWGVESGQTAVFHAPGSPATLYDGPGLTLAHNNTIEGLGFRDMETALWLPLDAQSTMADIYNNRFRSSRCEGCVNMINAVRVNMINDSELMLYLTGNRFEDVSNGLLLEAQNAFNVALEVHDNFFEQERGQMGLQHQLRPDGSGPSSFSLNASGNTFERVSYGIYTNAFVSGVAGTEAYTHVSNIWDNDFHDTGSDDYYLNITDDAVDPPGEVDVNVAVQGNRSVRSYNFIDMNIDFDSIPDGHIGIEIVDNQVLNGDSSAIDIDIQDAPDVDATIARNEILGPSGDAIQLNINNSGDEDGHVVTISDNVLGGTNDDGIDVGISGGLNTELTIARNSLTIIGNQGVAVDFRQQRQLRRVRRRDRSRVQWRR